MVHNSSVCRDPSSSEGSFSRTISAGSGWRNDEDRIDPSLPGPDGRMVCTGLPECALKGIAGIGGKLTWLGIERGRAWRDRMLASLTPSGSSMFLVIVTMLLGDVEMDSCPKATSFPFLTALSRESNTGHRCTRLRNPLMMPKVMNLRMSIPRSATEFSSIHAWTVFPGLRREYRCISSVNGACG